jgi:radical SAM/Cys-rich protein
MSVTYAEFTKTFTDLDIPDFDTRLPSASLGTTIEHLTTMQVNVGYACNFSCDHCFVDSSPQRTELMSKETMVDCLEVFAENSFTTLDITGGAPELNPSLAWFVGEGARLGKVMVRTNAALLTLPEYAALIDTFTAAQATVIVSLPCYTKENVDLQRGEGNYERIIAGLRALNAAGYGRDSQLELNLVYNPMGAYLPGAQCGLEPDYKRILGDEQGIVFDNLFCLANTPLGRFREKLQSAGELEDYVSLLAQSFNPATVPGLMCRNQLNVDYDGRLYDCEMNHVIGLPLDGAYAHISQLKGHKIMPRTIRTSGACYVCTAGSGSSCGGALV